MVSESIRFIQETKMIRKSNGWLFAIPYLICVVIVFAMQPDGDLDGSVGVSDALHSAWWVFALPAKTIEVFRANTFGQVVDESWWKGDRSVYLWALTFWAIVGAIFVMIIERWRFPADQDDE